MFCPNCGKEVRENQPFCANCGSELGQAAASQEAKAPELTTHVPSSILDKLPTAVKVELNKMPIQRQDIFLEEFRRKQKSKGLAYALWFVIGLHYIYLDKLGLQIFFWVTFGGLLIWWIIDAFRIPGMVEAYNRDKAIDVLRDMKIISAG
jgi:hypothetical protein